MLSRCPAATRAACPSALPCCSSCVAPHCCPHVAPCCSLSVVPCCPAQREPPCPAARASRCPALRPARRPALQIASRAALPLGPRTALPCSPARLALLPCPARAPLTYASRPAAARASRPAARASHLAAPRVVPCCPARRALLQPAPQAEPRRPARAALPIPSRAALPLSTAPPSRPATTNAAAARTVTTKLLLLPALLLPCRAALAATTGTNAGDGGAGGATRSAGGVGGPAKSAGGAANDCSPGGGGFGFMGTAQRWQQRPQGTFSLQRLRDCASQRCVPGCVEAAGLGACESAAALGARKTSAALGASASTATGPTSAEVLHTFTLDSGVSRCFFRDCTTVTPLATPVLVSLADPTGGPVVARASTLLQSPAVPSGTLSSLHLPAFSTNLLSNTVLQDVWVDTTNPGGQRVAICTCSWTGRHLATLTRQPGSSLYTLTTEFAHMAELGQATASSQVSASSQLAASCSCRLLSHQTLLWHHRLGHPSLPRLRSMHSRLLVFGLPRSLPPLPRSPTPPCLPCAEGWQHAAPHSFEFPPTTDRLKTLHMDVWGQALVSGMDKERYFLLVVDDYTSYTTVFPLRRKADVSGVLIPWIRATRRWLQDQF
ncbi:unnamed protein product [Closterium sp. NIES-53]